MFAIPWTVIIFVSIPELFLTLGIGSRLFNYHIATRNLIIISLCSGFLEYFYRLYLGFPWFNALALLITITALTSLLNHVEWWKTGIFVLLGAVIVVGIEAFCDSIMFSLMDLNYRDLAAQPWMNIITYIPSLVISISLLYFIRKKNLVLYNLKDIENEK